MPSDLELVAKPNRDKSFRDFLLFSEKLSSFAAKGAGLVCALAVTLNFAGCKSPEPAANITEPPLVPYEALPGGMQMSTPPAMPSHLHGYGYEDVHPPDEKDPPFRHKLYQAIGDARKRGVLVPRFVAERFAESQPLSRADFATWIGRYKELKLSRPPHSPYADVNDSDPRLPYAMAAVTQGWLQDKKVEKKTPIRKGPPPNSREAKLVTFMPDATITRQELCLIYARLLGRVEMLGTLRDQEIADLAPPDADPEETFSHVSDFETVRPEFRRFVGQAFADNLYLDVFGQTTEQVLEKGVLPNQRVSRGEALVFLDRLYGSSAIVPVEVTHTRPKHSTKH